VENRVEGAATAAPRPLIGKRIVLTGATGGLGRAMAVAFAAAGADVIPVARGGEALETLADELGSAPLAVDLTDPAVISSAMNGIGPVDVLVNNSGTNRPGPFEAVTVQDFDLLVNLNLRGTFFATQSLLPHIRAGGAILNVGSQMGHVGAENRTVYCATKHAIEGFTKALAIELAPRAIRVVSIAPTFIETPMTAPMFADPTFRSQVLTNIPMGRMGRPEDVAAAAVFLASDAAGMITGTSLLIDGGWTAH